jgi:hypothetical protein
MWDARELARTARAALEAASHQSTLEQAVHGIDSLCELDFHPILAAAFSDAGFGVERERPYPSILGTSHKRPKLAARQRCDLVLTPHPTAPLIDPVEQLRAHDALLGTLFESAAPTAPATIQGTRPEDAFWLEVKLVGQYCYTQGVPGPNRAYSSELTHSLYTDLAKIHADEALRWSGLLLIYFTDCEDTASHDLTIALHRSLDKGHTFRAPISESFPIPDRIGNAWCSVVVLSR